MQTYGILYLIGTIFLIVLAVLWFFLPFAVFGTQPKLDKVLAEAKRTNELLEAILASLASASLQRHSGANIVKCPQCGKEHSSGSGACPFCGLKSAPG
jgi:hypothetical protein